MPMIMPERGKVRNAFLINAHIFVLARTAGILLPGAAPVGKLVTVMRWGEEVFSKPLSLRNFRDLWDADLLSCLSTKSISLDKRS